MGPSISAREAGFAALKAGDATTAVERLQQAIGERPVDAEAWSALGVALCQANRVPEGVIALEKGVSQNPQRAALHFNLGRGLELAGRAPEALAAYRRCTELDSSHAGAAASIQRLAPAPAAGISDFAFGGAPAVPPVPSRATTTAPSVPPPPAVPPPPPWAGVPGAPAYAAPAQPIPPPPTYPGASPQSGYAPSGYGASAYSATGYGTPAYGATGNYAPPYGTPPPPPATPYQRPAAPPADGPVAVAHWSMFAGVLLMFVAGFGFLGYYALHGNASATATGDAPLSATTRPAAGKTAPPSTSSASSGGSFWPFHRSGSAGGDLSSTAPGPQVSDRSYGFSISFPSGFPKPSRSHMVEPLGFGGTAGKQVYECGGRGGHAYVVCIALAEEVYDKADASHLLAVGQHVMADSPFGSVNQHSGSQFLGNQSEDVRYNTHSLGTPRSGRGRTILARPRILVVGFESADAHNLDEPAVQAFLDSLRIDPNVRPPEARAPIHLPTHEMPAIPVPRMTMPPMPHYTPPTMPRFNPPPVPHFNPPQMPQFRGPNPGFPQPGGGSFGPRFGPGGGFPQNNGGAPGNAPSPGSGQQSSI